MTNLKDTPYSQIIRPRYQRLVPGLRDFGINSDVKVYKLNPDNSKGELLRVEPADNVLQRKFNAR